MKPHQWIPFLLSLQQILTLVVTQASPIASLPSPVTTAAASPANPLTTATSTWTTSSTSTIWQTDFGPNSVIHYITTQTITLTSSRGIFPSYPATVVDIGTTTVNYGEFVTPTTGAVMSSLWDRKYVSSTTFVVHRPQATDMPAGTTLSKVPCGPCSNATASYKTDATCDALKLDTACQGQCTLQDSMWWCRHLTGLEIQMNPEYQMGRVCWGNTSVYHQLMTPCVVGDHQFECLSCTGADYSGYNPTNWI